MGPLMIEITDRAARVRYVKELWSQLTVEERQEVIVGDLLPTQVTPPQEFPKVPYIPGTVSFYEVVTGKKPPPEAVRK